MKVGAKFLLRAVVCLIAAANVAASVEAEPISVQSPKAAQPTYAMGACRIRIAELFGGYFSIPDPVAYPNHGSYFLPATGPMAAPLVQTLGVDCFDAPKPDSAGELLSIKQDKGEWLHKDRFDNWVPFETEQHARVVQFKGSNWRGIGVFTDETTGDEDQRLRMFQFCLVHNAHALCGETPVASLSSPKENELSKVRAILQSIEFVDQGSSAASSVVPASDGTVGP